MFRSKTLFILGAGASCEFGLPSGNELKQQISSRLDIKFPDGYNQESGDRDIMDGLRRYCEASGTADVNDHLNAAWKIRDAMPLSSSIDNFLDAHQNDKRINICGKLAIAKSVIEAERKSALTPSGHKQKVECSRYLGTWLIPFAQRLMEGQKADKSVDILAGMEFIIFNYDRCLETALIYVLQDYLLLGQKTAEEAVNKATFFIRLAHSAVSLGNINQTLLKPSPLGSNFVERTSWRLRAV